MVVLFVCVLSRFVLPWWNVNYEESLDGKARFALFWVGWVAGGGGHPSGTRGAVGGGGGIE